MEMDEESVATTAATTAERMAKERMLLVVWRRIRSLLKRVSTG